MIRSSGPIALAPPYFFEIARIGVLAAPNICTSGACAGLVSGSPVIVFTYGTDLTLPPYHGGAKAVNLAGSVLWTYTSAQNSYGMLCAAGDVAGDGVTKFIVTFQSPDHTVALLSGAGAELWTYSFPAAYARGPKIGKLTAAAGNQILVGGASGHVVLLDKDGNLIWDSPLGGPTVQDVAIGDLDGSGSNGIVVIHDCAVKRLNPATGTVLWSTTLDAASQWCMDVAIGQVTGAAGKQIIAARTGQYTQPQVICLGPSGNILWSQNMTYPVWGVGCYDIDGDGYDEVFANCGTQGWESPGTPFPAEVVMLGKTGNTLCRRALAADGCTVNFFDVDGDGYAEVLMGGNDCAVHIVRARK